MIRFLLTSLLVGLIHLCLWSQNFNEILGRPTDHSITLSVLFDQAVETQVDYGLIPNSLSNQTPAQNGIAGTPVLVNLENLLPDTRYYYRTKYRKNANAAFTNGPVHTFHTQRAPGKSFTFTVEADEHLYDKKGIRSVYQICLANQAKDSADFMLSLGDIFGDDHTPLTTTSADMKALHLDYRQYLGQVCHSMPFFVCLGNHEGESGYYLDQTPPNNIAVYGTLWRKFYYPNPQPDDFYSGNMQEEAYGIGLPENYYAFTWGDALFVILDVYRDCDVNEKPQNWDWTLGKTQYDWFRATLENSQAKHKFVFCHHNRGQGRGGIVPAKGCEWGGYNNNGTGAYLFDQMRPGWGKPIHQLMVDNGVDIFFQGHDHLYAREQMDGVVYQEVPMPSDSTYQIGVLANADAYTDLTLDGAGHLRVRVTENCVTVDYVGAYLPKDTLANHKNREIRYSYTVGTCATATQDADAEKNNPEPKLFPNPAKNQLHLRTQRTSDSDKTLEMFDLQGRLLQTAVWPAGSLEFRLQLEGQAQGVYFLRISEQGFSKTLRFEKIN